MILFSCLQVLKKLNKMNIDNSIKLCQPWISDLYLLNIYTVHSNKTVFVTAEILVSVFSLSLFTVFFISWFVWLYPEFWYFNWLQQTTTFDLYHNITCIKMIPFQCTWYVSKTTFIRYAWEARYIKHIRA